MVTFHITNGTVYEFDFTNNTLHYNLPLNISIHNPNKFLGVYYDYVEASAWYHDVEFSSQTLGTFFQPHKNVRVLSHVFQGAMQLNADQISKMNKTKSFGIYQIDVKLFLKVRFRMGAIKTRKVKLKIHHPLLLRNGTML